MNLRKSESSKAGGALPARMRLLIYWMLFFGIALGMGYPRLDPSDPIPGVGYGDSVIYSRIVLGTQQGIVEEIRVLVPWVAKPIYWIAQGRAGYWNALALSLMISNCLFMATGAFFLLLLGRKCSGSVAATLGAPLLYLLNYMVIRRQVAFGLVDTGEACLMIVLFWTLYARHFFLLPVVGLLGALAKESFVPMSFLASLGWAFWEYKKGWWNRTHTLWLLVMTFVGLATVVCLLLYTTGRLILPWQLAAYYRAEDVGLLQGLIGCVNNRSFLYTFAWLLPLGAIGWRALPKPWIFASLGGAAAALAMGAWDNADLDTVPAIFNSLGPMLSLSAAHFLAGTKEIQRVPPQAGGA